MRPQPDPVAPGQESVWAYPRPAIAEPTSAHIVIAHAGVIVAETGAAIRTLETSHPPSYYVPPSDIAPGRLRRAGGGSFCEWKGEAVYWDVVIDDTVLPRVGWSYPDPTAAFAALRDHVAFYAGPFDRCIIDRLRARRIPVLLVGMKAPPLYGTYAAEFDKVFKDLAEEDNVAAYPFLLDGVALEDRYNQADGIHPNAEGVKMIVAGLAPVVEKALAGS